MKCSIVIATFNRKNFLSECLNSVLNQTYKNIEVIVIDDGSNDGTIGLLEEIMSRDKRLRFKQLEKNYGASVARNQGIAEAAGDLIMVWDSDDLLYPYAVERVVDTFSKQPELSIVSAPCKQLQNNKTLPYKQRPSGLVTLDQIICRYFSGNEKVRVARAQVYKNVKYQSRNIDFIVSGYLAEQGKWFHLDEELGLLQIQQDKVSLTSGRKKPNVNYSVERVPHLMSYLEKFGMRLQSSCPAVYAAHVYGVSLGLILNEKTQHARTLLTSAVKTHPLLLRCWPVLFLTFIPGATHILKVLFKIKT